MQALRKSLTWSDQAGQAAGATAAVDFSCERAILLRGSVQTVVHGCGEL
jgi:hypothetical protein